MFSFRALNDVRLPAGHFSQFFFFFPLLGYVFFFFFDFLCVIYVCDPLTLSEPHLRCILIWDCELGINDFGSETLFKKIMMMVLKNTRFGITHTRMRNRFEEFSSQASKFCVSLVFTPESEIQVPSRDFSDLHILSWCRCVCLKKEGGGEKRLHIIIGRYKFCRSHSLKKLTFW